MEGLLRKLEDKSYEKRKVHALELERVIRDAVANEDKHQVEKIMNQLRDMTHTPASSSTIRSGQIIAFAGAS